MVNTTSKEQLSSFLKSHDFEKDGAFITDLDGTCLLEHHGHIYIPPAVNQAFKAMYELHRPVIINTVRFPLSVIKTIGQEWYEVKEKSFPGIFLRGGLIGCIEKNEEGKFIFHEQHAFPLEEPEIDDILEKVKTIVSLKLTDVAVFYYPRKWQMGEIIWTPNFSTVGALKEKYTSACEIISGSLQVLKKRMLEDQACMIFLLINAEEDQLMAYQHTKKSTYFTHKGVDKKSSLNLLAKQMNISLDNSVGAGDTENDNFLESVGVAIQVNTHHHELPFSGLSETVRVEDPSELGDLLCVVESHTIKS